MLGDAVTLYLHAPGHANHWQTQTVRHRNLRSEPLVRDVSGVARLCRFKHQNLRFRVGHCAMLHTTRHNTEFARLQRNATITKLNRYLAAPNKEHFVLLLVVMPWKHSLEFHKFDLLPI